MAEKKYCWKKHPCHNNRCTLRPGHKGPCRTKILVTTWFGNGACQVCGGKSLISLDGIGYLEQCEDCGNKQEALGVR